MPSGMVLPIPMLLAGIPSGQRQRGIYAILIPGILGRSIPFCEARKKCPGIDAGDPQGKAFKCGCKIIESCASVAQLVQSD